MGISIPLSFKSISNRAFKNGIRTIKIKDIVYKILKRTFLLFFFGLVISNSDGKSLKDLRIFGVLQRFSVSYFYCAILELIFFSVNNYSYVDLDTQYPDINWSISKKIYLKSKFKEIFLYPLQWLVTFLIIVVWLLITFLLPVENCPTGYLGPGGFEQNGSYFNCTGGAAGYIDRLILGVGHVYQTPTSQAVYFNTVPYDPEGILGCLTSCALTYLGVSTGHIIIHYKEPSKRIVRFLAYGIIYGLIGAGLCKFSINDGWIPLNKNLWSLSFIFVMAGVTFISLTIMYLLIDIYDIYSGTPFLYLGRNSITIYICHIIFMNNFPNFKVPNKHYYLMANNLYCISLWCIVAAIMNYKGAFINL